MNGLFDLAGRVAVVMHTQQTECSSTAWNRAAS